MDFTIPEIIAILVSLTISIVFYFVSKKETHFKIYQLHFSLFLILIPIIVFSYLTLKTLLKVTDYNNIEYLFTKHPAIANALIQKESQEALQNLKNEYNDIFNGIILIKDKTKFLVLYEQFFKISIADGNELLATSLVNPDRYWNDKFRKINQNYIKNGGKITRIFIYTNNRELLYAKKEASIQKNMGINTILCYVPPEERSFCYKDFLINTKENIAIEYNVVEGDIYSAYLYSSENKINKLLESFSRLLQLSETKN